MKLIMENWRQYLHEEDSITTVGQLKHIIRSYRQKKAGKEVGIRAAEMAIEQIPILSNVFSLWKASKDAKEMIKTLYGAPDSFKSNTGLDMLNVDDDVSAIVDDKIESNFLNDLIDRLDTEDDDTPIPDTTEELQNFIANEFNSTTVKK